MAEEHWTETNGPIIEEFRSNGGRVGAQFEGIPLALVTMRGSKTGRTYVCPLAYGTDGDDIYVVASRGGAPKHPTWYHNVVANPNVRVEVGTDSYAATAVDQPEAERRRLYDKIAEDIPLFRELEARTERVIPVVRLVRTA